ncbi:MAG: tyrosine-type recombinase/integrase, partial [Planctomycetota bacterium]
ERGHRVRLYEARPGGPIMRSVYINGKEDRKSLGHRDREVAIRQAYQLLSALLANETAIDQESLTLGLLARLYLESPRHERKKKRTQRDDATKLKRVVAFLGQDRNVKSLCESDVARFVVARRRGDASLVAVVPGERIRDRTVQADLVCLVSALRWAAGERTRVGDRLLSENPLAGVSLPREANPRQPVMRHDEYLRLLKVADSVHSLLEVALVLAEGTGRRISAVRTLRWEDVDFRAGTIRWRAKHDKMGYEQVAPMSDAVSGALRGLRRSQQSIGNTPVFPAPRDPTRPCSRHLLDDWLRRAYRKAKMRPRPGGLWHPIRRKWVTERKGYPLKDVAVAGGWRDEQTVLRAYQQADAETVRKVVFHPTQRVSSP